ncbi:uncharacterized protein LOC121822320 [Peromyscus maniculatus bairdii]|uniref:uncharacterized protein LOC121822320 n=1 Tax=Peromyscus maniculatus bairdii TaxID=230844 RepID=UPI003FD0A23E
MGQSSLKCNLVEMIPKMIVVTQKCLILLVMALSLHRVPQFLLWTQGASLWEGPAPSPHLLQETSMELLQIIILHLTISLAHHIFHSQGEMCTHRGAFHLTFPQELSFLPHPHILKADMSSLQT